MPYAHNGKISRDPIDGGIEITDAQYQEALDGILNGLEVTIDSGFKVAPRVDPVPEPQPPKTPEQIKGDQRAAIQAQIDAIEDATKTGRFMREFFLTQAQIEARREAEEVTAEGTPTTAEQILAAHYGYQQALAVENQIKALRAQMKAIQ